MIPAALVFDLDGVIVKTNFTKHDAMLSLFDDHPDRRESISAFILSNGGVPRREKIARILRDHLQIEPTDSALARYLTQYAVRLDQHLEPPRLLRRLLRLRMEPR
jgi:beta-phosphoglucomutase-like phosphatase (HAD superfamily)